MSFFPLRSRSLDEKQYTGSKTFTHSVNLLTNVDEVVKNIRKYIKNGFKFENHEEIYTA